MAYRNLITFERLRQANTGKTVSDLTEIAGEAKSVITGVSSFLRSRLERALIVEAVTQRVAEHHWSKDETRQGDHYWTYADQQPIVQVEEGGTRQTKRRLSGDRPQPGALRYYAGYRRPDQVLSGPTDRQEQLPTGGPNGFGTLTTLPPTLPAVIQQVAINLTLHVLDKRGDELGRRSTRTIGGQETVVEGADPGFLQRQVSRLSKYDRSHVLRGPTETEPLTSS